MNRTLTCIICPLGCEITVRGEGEALEISGNTCARGKVYAEQECKNPMRTVTSTVRCTDGTLLPVKTAHPIPKARVADCMKIINHTVATLPVQIGDVILEDVFGSALVATQNRKPSEKER